MIAFFSLATAQLFDKSLQKIVWVSLVLSVLLLVTLWSVVGVTLSQPELFSTGWFYGAFDWVFIKITSIFGSVLILALTWFLFPSIVTLTITFFLERVINRVERKHYPNLQPQRRQNTLEVIRITVKFMLLSVIVNILVIPFYAVFFFLGPVNLLIFYMVNGYLLGKEYFELVAYRRLEPNKVNSLFNLSRGNVFRLGIISALLMTVPIINMVTPIISVAAMVHLVQKYNNDFTSLET
jgi:CysZ protein